MPARTAKSARLEARVTKAHQALIQRAATLRGQSVTDFVLTASLTEARRALSEHDTLELTADEQRRFVDAMLQPNAITRPLKRAFASHKRLIES